VVPEQKRGPVVGEDADLHRVGAGWLVRRRRPEEIERLGLARGEGVPRNVVLEYLGTPAVVDLHVHDDAGREGAAVLDRGGDGRGRAWSGRIRRRGHHDREARGGVGRNWPESTGGPE